MNAVLDALGDELPPADLADDELIELFAAANEAALATPTEPAPRSRVVAMSDGFTDYCEGSSQSRIAEGSELPTTIVERLVRTASMVAPVTTSPSGVLLDSVPSRRVLADLAHPLSPSTSLMPM